MFGTPFVLCVVPSNQHCQICSIFVARRSFSAGMLCCLIQLFLEGSLLCFLASCHSVFVCSFAGRDLKKKKKIVWGRWGQGWWVVQEWYREIDEAVRAGVITRCPFHKPDWQTAYITQTPGPDRNTTTPHLEWGNRPLQPSVYV